MSATDKPRIMASTGQKGSGAQGDPLAAALQTIANNAVLSATPPWGKILGTIGGVMMAIGVGLFAVVWATIDSRIGDQATGLLQLRQSFDDNTKDVTDRLIELKNSNAESMRLASISVGNDIRVAIKGLEDILVREMKLRDQLLGQRIDSLGSRLGGNIKSGFDSMKNQLQDLREDIPGTVLPQGGSTPLIATDVFPAPRPARLYDEYGIGSKYSIRRDAGFRPENGDEEPDARDLGAIEPAADTPWPPGDIDNRSLAIDGTTTSPMFGAATRMAPNETED